MIAGLLRSGARLQRYEHLRLDHLEELLLPAAGTGRTVFVVTETVFSMDGDYPDLAGLAELKRRHGFHLIVDEAHALGWHGPRVRAWCVPPAWLMLWMCWSVPSARRWPPAAPIRFSAIRGVRPPREFRRRVHLFDRAFAA